MTEDRHTFSEPRPIAGLALPSWDVDVYRDGVPEPILTLRVDETLLPARKSKKKKVVWQLPETVDQVPRFGADEKRRLLDIFKSLKKERRKSKRGSLGAGGEDDNNSAPNSAPNSGGGAIAAVAAATAVAVAARQQQNGICNNAHTRLDDDNIAASNATTTAATHTPATTNPTLGMEHLSVGLQQQQQQCQQPPPPGPPPGISTSRQYSNPPPPGLAPASTVAATNNNVSTNGSAPQGGDNHKVAPPPPGISRPQSMPETMPGTSAPPGLLPQPIHRQQLPATGGGLPMASPLPPSRFFNLLHNMPHELFATQVANLYISLLQTGQVEELLLYYSLTAQKSLSLKSAKSICATPLEMKTQLQSLAGCPFVVQGITVHHNPLDPKCPYMLMIWSGICQVQGHKHGFCHTLVLTPMIDAAGSNGTNDEQPVTPRYQIQNDALVLLANE